MGIQINLYRQVTDTISDFESLPLKTTHCTHTAFQYQRKGELRPAERNQSVRCV